jgi:D-arginine dehydrogenase
MERYDVAVIGAGMAGASVACLLAQAGARVVLLEAEGQPGYHATGRSAAFYAETYGGPQVQPLTTGSKAFFHDPPVGFADQPLVTPRGALFVAQADQADRIAPMVAAFHALSPAVTAVDPAFVVAHSPALRPDAIAGGVWDPECQDIAVAALHQGYLRGFRRAGGTTLTDAAVSALRYEERWHVAAGPYALSAEIVINAAGAWADAIALLAGEPTIGLSPRRRTIIVFDPEPELALPEAPLTLDIDERFYFKPDAGRIWASPADETPVPPGDAQPDELDIAITVDRLQAATRFGIPCIRHSWAGLRSFAPDRAPVIGFGQQPGFFWLAGQGGFGIQTAPAAARLAAALAQGHAVPADLAALGVTPERYGPGRLTV